MSISRTLVLVSLVVSTPMLIAQAPAPPVAATSAESGQLAQGLAWLAQGDTARAAELATRLLTEYPGSAAVASFAVDVDLARAGAIAALDTYERWLGSKRLESGYVLRQVARAVLRTAARDQASSSTRLEALKALAADDDREARAELDQAVAAGGSAEAAILATKGDDRAVKLLIDELTSIPGSKARQIDALGASRNPLAIKPLIAMLSDPMDINRSQAADALGKLGAQEAIVKLKPLLNDQFFPVRVKAAGALYRLNDMSGLSFLRQLESSEHAGYRLAAAEAMSSTPDAAWQNLVRGLTQDPDPKVRTAAARLIAPHDQELARTTLERLLADDNIAIRELAASSYSETVANDFAALRRVLRTGDTPTRIRAAARILELTR